MKMTGSVSFKIIKMNEINEVRLIKDKVTLPPTSSRYI